MVFIYLSFHFFPLATHADQNKKYIIGFKCYHFKIRGKTQKKKKEKAGSFRLGFGILLRGQGFFTLT